MNELKMRCFVNDTVDDVKRRSMDTWIKAIFGQNLLRCRDDDGWIHGKNQSFAQITISTYAYRGNIEFPPPATAFATYLFSDCRRF